MHTPMQMQSALFYSILIRIRIRIFNFKFFPPFFVIAEYNGDYTRFLVAVICINTS